MKSLQDAVDEMYDKAAAQIQTTGIAEGPNSLTGIERLRLHCVDPEIFSIDLDDIELALVEHDTALEEFWHLCEAGAGNLEKAAQILEAKLTSALTDDTRTMIREVAAAIRTLKGGLIP